MKYLALLLLGGCILPVSTGAPLPATTVGAGKAGFSASGEAPVLDLIANNKTSTNNDYTSTYGESPAATATLTLSYGLASDTDLEVGLEGALYYFFLPLPTGMSIGIRQHLLASDAIDVAIAGRVGFVTTGSTQVDASGNSTSDEASAEYGAVQGIVQLHSGKLRPLLAVNLMPFHIVRGIQGSPVQKFSGLASSATLGIMFVSRHAEFGPYVTVTDFASETFSGGQFVSGGLMLSIRPDRSYVPPPPQVMTPAPPPPMPYPAQPMPYPGQPMPAPAPAPGSPYPAPPPSYPPPPAT